MILGGAAVAVATKAGVAAPEVKTKEKEQEPEEFKTINVQKVELDPWTNPEYLYDQAFVTGSGSFI